MLESDCGEEERVESATKEYSFPKSISRKCWPPSSLLESVRLVTGPDDINVTYLDAWMTVTVRVYDHQNSIKH